MYSNFVSCKPIQPNSPRIIFKNQTTNFRYKNFNGACVQIPLEEILRVYVFVMIIIINKSFTYKEISLQMCRYLRKLVRYNIRTDLLPGEYTRIILLSTTTATDQEI